MQWKKKSSPCRENEVCSDLLVLATNLEELRLGLIGTQPTHLPEVSKMLSRQHIVRPLAHKNACIIGVEGYNKANWSIPDWPKDSLLSGQAEEVVEGFNCEDEEQNQGRMHSASSASPKTWPHGRDLASSTPSLHCRLSSRGRLSILSGHKEARVLIVMRAVWARSICAPVLLLFYLFCLLFFAKKLFGQEHMSSGLDVHFCTSTSHSSSRSIVLH
jgi:hypothetical protein